MPKNDLLKVILTELQEVKKEIKEVRQTDIPALRVDVAGFHSKLKSLESKQAWSTRLYTILGGAIAIAVTKFTGHA